MALEALSSAGTREGERIVVEASAEGPRFVHGSTTLARCSAAGIGDRFVDAALSAWTGRASRFRGRLNKMSTEIVVGREREERLLAFGLPRGLLEILGQQEYDPITALVACSEGTGLAEIVDMVGVAGALPSGRVIPICHIEESDLVYYLLLEDEQSLVWWSAEGTEPVAGGITGFLTDLVVSAWEAEAAPDQLVAWAERIGHPAARRLVEALAVTNRHTPEEALQFRRAFLETLA